jgi:hypothetical protein
VLRTLQNDGIPVIALKGAHLAEVVYGNIALRPMGDVDLLVRKTDLSRVEGKLLETGYGPPERPSIEEQCEKSQHLVGFAKQDTFLIEIHWNIECPTSPFTIEVDGLWKRARPAAIAGVNVLVLSLEDLVLHLCLHASFHHTFCIGLRPLCDISETIRHYRDEIDWKQVQLRSQQWGVEKCVYLTLKVARELLGATVPDDLMKAIKPSDFDERFMGLAKEQIFPNTVETGKVLTLSPNVAQLWGSKRLLDKAGLFFRKIFLSPEVMARIYPASSDSIRIYFYYPVRIKDLLLQHGRQVWRLLRRDEGMTALARQENNITSLKEWLMSA